MTKAGLSFNQMQVVGKLFKRLFLKKKLTFLKEATLNRNELSKMMINVKENYF